VTGVYGRDADVAKRMMAERRADRYRADLYLNGMTTGYNVLAKLKGQQADFPVDIERLLGKYSARQRGGVGAEYE
jgi:hypothetical protein